MTPNFIKAVTTLFIAAGISGCATTEQTPQTVFIPVIAPKPTLPARPILSIASLNADAEPATVIRAYAESVAQCTGYAIELESILKK